MATSAPSASSSTLSFHFRNLLSPNVSSSSSAGNTFRPRIGRLILTRPGVATGSAPQIEIPTPNLWIATSRGVVPHLTRDNVARSVALAGIHLTFESYLESNPPIPTLVPGPLPLHAFHGFDPHQHLLSFGLRNPNDAQIRRANGNNYVIAQCARGSKQVVPKQFHRWAIKLQPDIIFALPDIPYTPAPYSQKRLTKSNERSARWLIDLVILREEERSHPPVTKISDASMTMSGPAIFTHLVGGSVLAARDAFAENLLEKLSERDATLLPKLDSIDEAVSGYILDLVPIRLSFSMSLDQPAHPYAPLPNDVITPMIHASLQYLSEQKPRLATGASTPHEILRLINFSGIDLFDSSWAQRAADHGVALDFRFPVGTGLWSESQVRGFVQRSAALNLYDSRFAADFSRLSDGLMSAWDAHQAQRGKNVELERGDLLVCKCIACSPEVVTAPIVHSDAAVLKSNSAGSCNNPGSEDTTTMPSDTQSPPLHFSRAYLHHLLHTHEMSAHTFLTAHNLAVLDAFFAGIRSTMAKTHGSEASLSMVQSDTSTRATTLFEKEFARFEHVYDESLLWGTPHSDSSGNITPSPHSVSEKDTGILEEAERRWREVNYLRGKGRLKREKEAALAVEPEG